mmetsp:Transcript_35255/g.92934  ORF Transcript_35255/g.92934 Transcript_35255/m.92934 type:complete len:187 (-) Transcript_35255:61-621(-)
MRLLALLLMACLPISNAGGDHDHGHGNSEEVQPSTFDVTWMIPTAHTHSDGGDEVHHDMTVELGEGKRLSVRVNDVVNIAWTNSPEDHDLQSLAGADELSGCNFTGAEEMVAPKTTGSYTLETSQPVTYYLSCKTAGHCAAKQKLIVEVTAVASSASARFRPGQKSFLTWALSVSALVGVWWTGVL